MRATLRLGAVVLSVTLGACAAAAPPAATVASGDAAVAALPPPGTRFDQLESDLLAAEDFRLVFSIRGEGLIESDLRGDYRRGPDHRRSLNVAGSFAGDEVRLALLVEDPGLLILEANEDRREVPMPAFLDEALLLGLTRMGLLHNIARLTGRLEPEGARGGFREAAACLCFEERGALDLALKIFWGGDFVADAELRFDADGRPRERIQTVHFPAGEMRVVETYEVFAID